MPQKNIEIKNRKAKFEYEWIETFTAGMVLLGTEIKALRQGKGSIVEAYCFLNRGELFIKNMNIGEYSHGNINNHDPVRERKLLLSKRELQKIERALKDTGITVIPTKMFISERGLAKMNIAIAKGKKLYDKRQAVKERDVTRDLKRQKLL
ncbi:MAG: SsrA-binding protein SmpB [Schleiferiaceae bacterium]|nr:SsrA-binding protein SmpB [Schleiferiaceae bacterium]